jgi:hypothetical protein
MADATDEAAVPAALAWGLAGLAAGVALGLMLRPSREAPPEEAASPPMQPIRAAGPENLRDEERRDWDAVDQASDASFPASDPPAYSPGPA